MVNPMRIHETRLPGWHSYTALSLGGQAIILINPSSEESDSNRLADGRLAFEDICKRAKARFAHDGIYPSPALIIAWQQCTPNEEPDLRQITPELPCRFSAEGMAALAITRQMLTEKQTTGSNSFGTATGNIECRIEPADKFSFRCKLSPIPALVIIRQQQMGVPGIGLVGVDVVFAGEFFLLAEAESLGIRVGTSLADIRRAEDFGTRLLGAAPLFFNLNHPVTGEAAEAAGVIFTASGRDSMKQTVVYRNGTVGRSAGLAASAARMALTGTGRMPATHTEISSPTGDLILVQFSHRDDINGKEFLFFNVETKAVITKIGYLNLS